MSHRTVRRCLPAAFGLGAALLLAACGVSETPRREAPPAPSNAQMVQAIRAAGDREQSVINVHPLADPGVTALRDAARADEQAGRYADAAHRLDQALKLTPGAPDLLQDRAEAALYLGDYAIAERLARQSWSLGPKLGPLCVRNWQTVLELRQRAGDGAGASAARQQLAACHKAGVQRF
ncbi:tetratricopeptide repeat protein [Fulvimonas sp. R45]|uniref:tetratricopeptide repeat protein n=1 Tax=Fulvimonas sp. R45 TaxID=3045937 RepID=UPI00265F1C0D|nr:tetratricopeptide repeat protein [Fulvimonas sp. R45]MDO1528112.1 tetratricopeptide repeat protein [Fulvimonas sp. R45]